MRINWKHKLASLTTVCIALIVIMSLFFVSSGAIQISSKGLLSIQANISLATSKIQQTSSTPVPAITTVEQTSWGYQYALEKGDIVEVGENPSAGFQAMVKTIRGDKWFSLSVGGGTFTPTLSDLTISFDFNSSIGVSIYPVAPCDRLPDGGIEYDVILKKKVAQSTVSFNIDWSGITWQKIYGLNVEYTEAKCEDVFGIEAAPYTITATSIVGSDNVTYKTRQEYEVNSYIGIATVSTQVHDENWGTGLPSYTRLSHTYLYIHRGQMTDALGNKAWVEDINLNEAQKTLTFSLPSTWLKGANYPVHGVCGVDPAYTEKMANFQSTSLASDGTWDEYDTTSIAGADGVVLEFIMANTTTGTENTMGLSKRASDHTPTTSTRYVTIHEAEGGGQTHCRMFVQSDANGIICAYHSDVSDADYFYLVGYWSNVTFTEAFDSVSQGGTQGAFNDRTLLNGASCIHQIIATNGYETAPYAGVRANGSSIDRRILLHEAESGGVSAIDWLVKADANKIIETYRTDSGYGSEVSNNDAGYFSSELDFVEKWENITPTTGSGWLDKDLTAYLDQDGRMVDTLCVHKDEASYLYMGVRANGSSLGRYINEHEAESAGSGNEYAGFSMSVQSDNAGIIEITWSATFYYLYYLTGYFKPSSSVNISTNASSRAISGVVAASTTYYTYSGTTTAPSWPLADGECYFYVTNDGTVATDIYIHGHNWTGGVGWTLTTGSPGADSIRIYWFDSGDGSGDGTVVNTTDTQVLDELAASAHEHFDFKVETGSSFTDGVAKSGIVTITGTID